LNTYASFFDEKIKLTCSCLVNGPIDHNKAKERGHFETAWHPQVQQRVQQQPVSF